MVIWKAMNVMVEAAWEGFEGKGEKQKWNSGGIQAFVRGESQLMPFNADYTFKLRKDRSNLDRIMKSQKKEMKIIILVI